MNKAIIYILGLILLCSFASAIPFAENITFTSPYTNVTWVSPSFEADHLNITGGCLNIINGTYNQTGCFQADSPITMYVKDYNTTQADWYTTQPYTFSIQINHSSNVTSQAGNFVYNNTAYTATKVSYTDYDLFYVTVTLPTVTSDSTLPFYWNLTETLSDASTQTYRIYSNHTVYSSFAFDDCSGFDDVTLTMNIFNEQIPANALNATVELTIDTWINDPDNPMNYSTQFNGNSTYNLCMNYSGVPFYADAYIKYNTTGGFTHRFFLVNQSFTNETTTVNMYNFYGVSTDTGTTTTTTTTTPATTTDQDSYFNADTNETNTTTTTASYNLTSTTTTTINSISDLKVTVRNKDTYSYFENVIVSLERYYPAENVWRAVQMDETGNFGLSFFNIEEEDTDYRFIFRDRSNNILDTTERLKFICTNSICDLTFLIDEYSASSTAANLTITPSYNNLTGNITVEWNDPTGLTSSVIINVTTQTLKEKLSICAANFTGASSGSYQCDVSAFINNTIRLDVSATASPLSHKLTEWYEPTARFITYLGVVEAGFWSFIIMLAIIGLGIITPATLPITIIAGLVLLMYLGLAPSLSISAVIIAGALGLIISFKVRD